LLIITKKQKKKANVSNAHEHKIRQNMLPVIMDKRSCTPKPTGLSTENDASGYDFT
jgi:hypothetical protein